MIPDTEEFRQKMAESWKLRAAEYAASPQKGYAEGYEPMYLPDILGPVEGGVRQPSIKGSTPETAWLRGIVAKDSGALGWDVKVIAGMGAASKIVFAPAE